MLLEESGEMRGVQLPARPLNDTLACCCHKMSVDSLTTETKNVKTSITKTASKINIKVY